MCRPRLSSRSWLILVFALTLLTPGLTAAEPPRCARESECTSHLDRGIALDLDQKYEPALKEFQAAYKQHKDPRLALNIGRTLHKLGRFAEALSLYTEAGRAAPADTELQKQLQDFIAQAKQNLPTARPAPVTVVNNLPPLQTAPVNLTATMKAINQNQNHNHVRVDLKPLHPLPQAEPRPLYKRASLWGPLVGVALAASAAGIAAAAWPRPWQPDPQIPTSSFSAVTVGGAK